MLRFDPKREVAGLPWAAVMQRKQVLANDGFPVCQFH
jgi:hypothetical protein